MSKMQISIDVTDWLNEYMQKEADVTTLDALIDRATDDGIPLGQLARLAIVARERGELEDDDLLPENKSLLNTGGNMAVNLLMARQTRLIETGNGETYKVRTLIAPVRSIDDASQADDEAHAKQAQTFDSEAGVTPRVESTPPDTPGLASLGSPKALRYAELYLERRVPGYIVGRLRVIKHSGGDVREAGELLKAKIDEMVEELSAVNSIAKPASDKA